MFKSFIAAALTAGALAAAGSASAVTYTSKLEYRDGLVGPQSPYGLVTLEEVNAKTLKVTVTLTDANSRFVNTGGPHDPFLFNLPSPATVTVQNVTGTEFSYAGDGSYDSTPFGTFTDKIACCKKSNGQEGNGLAYGDRPPLVFTLYNASGLTFAGLGATFNPTTGRLLTTGTGNHLVSNAGGWWFAADIYDGKTGLTYNVAARDAFGPLGAVPEPGTWALMIMGFGTVGAMLRRRRAVAA